MINDIFDWVLRLFESLALTIVEILKDYFFSNLDKLLEITKYLIEWITEALDFIDFDYYWSMIPSDIFNFLGALGLGQALTMITTTWIIKLTIRQIPFIRL